MTLTACGGLCLARSNLFSSGLHKTNVIFELTFVVLF